MTHRAYCRGCSRDTDQEVLYAEVVQKETPYSDGVKRLLENIKVDQQCSSCNKVNWTIDNTVIYQIDKDGTKRVIA